MPDALLPQNLGRFERSDRPVREGIARLPFELGEPVRFRAGLPPIGKDLHREGSEEGLGLQKTRHHRERSDGLGADLDLPAVRGERHRYRRRRAPVAQTHDFPRREQEAPIRPQRSGRPQDLAGASERRGCDFFSRDLEDHLGIGSDCSRRVLWGPVSARRDRDEEKAERGESPAAERPVRDVVQGPIVAVGARGRGCPRMTRSLPCPPAA